MKVDDGKIKNKCLPGLVKIALVLPHRNADVERSLSVNTNVVTEDRPAKQLVKEQDVQSEQSKIL